MSSSFAANRANNTTKSEERQMIQTRPQQNFNRKQDENRLQLGNRAGKVADRNNSSRTKAQQSNDKLQNKTPAYEEKLNVAGAYNKRPERTFKKERDQVQPINDYSVNKQTKGNKTAEKKVSTTRNVSRNNQDLKNSIYQPKPMRNTNNIENDLDNIVNITSKLSIQNNRNSASNIQQHKDKSQQNNSGGCNNHQMPEQFNNSDHFPNNYIPKAPKLIDSQNNSSKLLSHNTKLSAYGPQIGNGFAYDPSKIVGFQSKEANEYAINMLKSQGMALQQPPTPSTQIHVANQTSASVTFIAPTASIYVAQAQQPASQFGMVSGKTWPWKEGDLCLAKYWDDGNVNIKIILSFLFSLKTFFFSSFIMRKSLQFRKKLVSSYF